MMHDIPGSEVPAGIYRLSWFAFVWMLFAAWIVFGRACGVDVDLVVVTIIVAVMSLLPMLVRKTACRHEADFETPSRGADATELETATGKLGNGEAYLQILLIPVALAVAASAFSLVYLLTN
jgi:uncharacterized membrane protein